VLRGARAHSSQRGLAGRLPIRERQRVGLHRVGASAGFDGRLVSELLRDVILAQLVLVGFLLGDVLGVLVGVLLGDVLGLLVGKLVELVGRGALARVFVALRTPLPARPRGR